MANSVMNKSTFTRDGAFDEEVIFCLERQMIPAWERYGMEHLAVSEKTLQELKQQPLPEQMQIRVKKRRGKHVVKRPKATIVNTLIESWPEDDLLSSRFPVLMYVRGGKADIQLGDYVVQCPPEHFLLLSPGVPQPAGQNPHMERPCQGKSCELWWFRPSGHDDFVALTVCYSVEDEHYYSGNYYIVNDAQVAQIYHAFTREAMDRHHDYAKISFSLLHAFLRLFLREFKAGRFYNRGINLPKSVSSAISPIEMARQYIEKNLNHPLTIDIVARAVFMAKTSFMNQFQQETGQTFREYLMERRLEEAKRWLLGEACSVEKVCQFVGLKNSRFHELFKQRFGMTPGEFRKRHKNV
jgi:AraC-like DNA-binding protein